MAEPALLLFFDGDCHLCNGLVQRILARDRAARFHFAPLESPYAQDFFARHAFSCGGRDTMVFYADGRFLIESEAALAVAARLPAPWRWLRVARVFPRGWRDGLYRFIAARRHRWFGRGGVCRLPTPEEAARFHE